MELSLQQREAVEFGDGPLLIIAGAGTGKTRVITHRIAHLITIKRAKPEEILALTFTDKAALEMEERVDVLVPYGYTDIWISTFHAFGDRILRDYAIDAGLTPDFRVLSRPEQIIFFREHLFEFPLNYYRPLGDPTRHIEAILTLISRAKDEDISPEEYIAFAKELADRSKREPGNSELAEDAFKQMEIALTYQRYQELLAENGFIDFGDQVFMVLRLLRARPTILVRIQKRFRYILVDEFQDTNYAQFQLVRLLSDKHKNITVVGDDDQSIYKWRGAAISNMLNFLKVYPKARLLVLTQNYRSTQEILDYAYRLVRYNDPDRLEVKNKIDKRLISNKGERGQPVRHLYYDTISSEAEGVAKLIKGKVATGKYSYRDFAILVRANDSAEPFLKALNLHKIPYRFTGNRGLYAREEIRLLICFLRSISYLYDSVSLYYLASSEIYSINALDLTRCMNIATRRNRTLHYVFNHLLEFPELEETSEESRKAIARLVEDLEKYTLLSKDYPTGVVLYRFLTDTGYLNRLSDGSDHEAEEKIQNIAKFFNISKDFGPIALLDRVPQFVKHLEMLMAAGDDPATAEVDTDADAVNVLTVHKAKGLEFPIVFMVGLVADRFPSRRRRESIELPESLVKDIMPEGDFHLQEERRLFYVGMTRAREELYFTSARDYGGLRPRKVSQFILEVLDLRKIPQKAYATSPMEVLKRFDPPSEHAISGLKPLSPEEVLNLSYFQIDDYLTCPLKYKYVHILKVPILPHHSIIYGNSLHKAVQYYFRRKMEGNSVTLDELLGVFEKVWVSEGFLTREHEEQRLKTGRSVLEQFYKKEEANRGIIPTFIEKEFSFFLDNNRIIGRWDRLDERDGEVIVIDYKSSEVRQQKEADKKAKESLQLSIYALAYYERFGKIPDRVELHFLETGLVGSDKKNENDLEETKAKIRKSAEGIRMRDLSAKPEYLACRYCAYTMACPSKGS